MPNGLVDEPKSHTVTELCQRMFVDIVKSEKFAELCHVLFENFEGMKADNFFDISRIHSRMKDGSYEGSSLLFHSDIQQVLFYFLLFVLWIQESSHAVHYLDLANNLARIS